ncbi:MAG TPA: SgcJ/EcaC family oxidoreductase [Gemmatimonadales bacterium]|nr:SgcJ/EcaC family oxidoreductase [Gemmatimonadales bacterium]
MTEKPESHEIAVRFRELLAAWNSRQANVFASLFSETALVIGYDGSQMTGRAEVESSLQAIFSHHETAAYVSKVRSVRQLGPDVAILHAVVGMIPPGQSDLSPDRNAVQTLVGHRTSAGWQIENFQNTPAAFHGRPELGDQLTEELRTVLRQR